MSVLVGSAKLNEFGGISGGQPGDQKGGQEVATQPWYKHKKGWYVIRPVDESVAAKIAQCMEWICANDNIGYCQTHRHTLEEAAATFQYDVSKVNVPCETDCSAAVKVCILYAGISVGDMSTSEMPRIFRSHPDFTFIEDSLYCDYSNLLRRGDILVTRSSGHTVVVLSNGDNCPADYAGSADVFGMCSTIGALYDTEVTRDDAVLREVGYINPSNQPSIVPSNIRLSVINYTNMLGDLFAMYAPQNISNMTCNIDVNVDSVNNPVAKQILIFLLEKGLNAAAACGILGNIQQECSFNISSINSAGYSGICQWGGGRKDAMRAMAQPDWRNNLTGQLNYMWAELQGDWKRNVYDVLATVPNTPDGLYTAADVFCRKYEVCGNYGVEVPKRANYGKRFWDCLVFQQI